MVNLPSEIESAIFDKINGSGCKKMCLTHFRKGEVCPHDFTFCKDCQEIWYDPLHETCPRCEIVELWLRGIKMGIIQPTAVYSSERSRTYSQRSVFEQW